LSVPHRLHQPTLGTPASAILGRYRQVRAATESLCRPLATDDYSIQSMPDASPAKWHLAHTSWFFEEFVLKAALPEYAVFDASFGFLFNSYYESVGPRQQRPERGLLSRPTIEHVWAYREHVDEEMQRVLERPPSAALEQVITLGLHHEQQHQELLLTDLKHLFSLNPLKPAYVLGVGASARSSAPPSLAFLPFSGGLTHIGHDGADFCFDNECARHRVYLEPFRLANRLATNGEYLQFIRSGGYARHDHWLADGWACVQREQWRHPLYWSDSLEQEFTFGGLRALDPSSPVCHLSYYEADAFARWAGARLPTEFEWESVATRQATDSSTSALPLSGNFVEEGLWHPVTAASACREHARSAMQLFGDVWEWTASAYAPYPRFRPMNGALGEYNGKFMVNQLVLRGGSCATPRSHFRATYRNFFYPTARWQFSGVRLAADTR
jgi:ergothioneine biosynthesis protein EgtB